MARAFVLSESSVNQLRRIARGSIENIRETSLSVAERLEVCADLKTALSILDSAEEFEDAEPPAETLSPVVE